MTRLLEWLGDIGADPNDDIETRTRKALLVHLAVLILPISLVWCVLYLALGAPSGVVAFAYTRCAGCWCGRANRWHSTSTVSSSRSRVTRP